MARNSEISEHPLRYMSDLWMSKIDIAIQQRHERFGRFAEEAMQFFDGNHDWMWEDAYAKGAGGFLDKSANTMPTFRISVNKLFEAVALFGPALYHQNPNVQVTPIMPPEVTPEALGIAPDDLYGMAEYEQLATVENYQYAQKKACASVKQRYLNWLQTETDKKTEMRRAVTEAIVAGVGYLETTIHQPPFSKIKLPRSQYVSWWDVVIDPDAKYWEQVQWIAIRRTQPVNKVEEKYGLEAGELKGHMQSKSSQATKRGKKEARQNRESDSFDLCEYWEIYSKNGFGDRLRKPTAVDSKHNFEVFGDFCHFVASRGIPFPLNMPTTALATEDVESLFLRAQWPIPFWYDSGGWPISRITFYDKPYEIWPISLFKPAIGELRFINWCMSFLADKVAGSCHTYVGVIKAASESIQKQLVGGSSPFTIVEISDIFGKSIKEVVSFLESPQFNDAIWNMLAQVLDLIDKRTGLTELVYGMSSRQMRSAAEANVKEQNVSIRPDDMASSVESAASECAVREIQAARWMCEEQDVAPCLGQLGTLVWSKYVMTNDVDAVVRDFDYRIEAGTARKPNKATKIAQLTELGQYVLPVFQQFAAAGQVAPFNAYMTEMCKAMDLDPEPFLVELPQANGPSPEEQAAQAQMQLKMQEFELKLAEMQTKLGMDRETHEQELEQSREKHELELEQGRAKMKLEQDKAKAQAAAAKTKATATRKKP